ncbi:phospholipid-translocating P-type ATPase [Laetiporus sulphureus 93-53]|uniref:Phospholipid-transporting ATPase n=1 Tax=Laetiporus sulphureus 93-53 TaxID=1314785 RepID=A0A165C8C3_9APHY|nr:phospholipid-translocating P-type ATPase [Laetiporus sulphureus 93-53]KZT02376.1 phospholipid-translocating P-type ATPase [Laetiporus sulphureus 93-53]
MAGFFSKVATWYNKTNTFLDNVVNFNVEEIFNRSKEVGPPRTVFVHQSLPEDYLDHKGRIKKEHVYCTNQTITSKYSLVTFIPRNLLEQFRRVANIFFLAIAILQFFSIFSTISPGLAILPLLIILAITGLKDGYEDFKRHQSDHSINHSEVLVLKGGAWRNPNAMQGKEKTFMPAIVPTIMSYRKKRAPVADVEAIELERAAPPEGVDGQLRGENGQDNAMEGVEFDDDDQDGGLFRTLSGDPEGDHARPHWKKIAWEDIKVGDFVKIMDNESFPADILICATSEDENVCYVETKNLDGETNLKSRTANPALTHLRSARECADIRNSFQVDCDRPDNNLYKLNAAVVSEKDSKSAVDISMVLLRGTVLRNTRWVIGLILFTGNDTKIMLNSGGAPSKRSKVERQMNPQVFINLIILAAMAVVCGIVDAVLEQRYYPRLAPWLYDDNQSDNNTHVNGVVTFAFALITFQNIIPISLYISVEAVRTCQALFIYFDHEMYYKETDTPTLARSWNLSDDLGQIEYIFSDKTGTLTQNVMIFRQCSVGGRAYRGNANGQGDEESTKVGVLEEGEATGSKSSGTHSPELDGKKTPVSSSLDVPNPLAADKVGLAEHVLSHFRDAVLAADIASAKNADPQSEASHHAHLINGFFSCLALCHTALVSVDPARGSIEYKAQSPDEAALVQAAADAGFVFRGRDREILTLQTPFSEEYERYELLNILEFTSSRKRMSVIVRKLDDDEKEKVFLLTKGADNVIFERLVPGSNELKKATEGHLDEFASDGLRTLTLAYKVITDDEYDSWNRRYLEASVSLEDREGKVDACYEEIEHNLRLLGATAIEDRLQDGVPETIADLKEAGIKIWVATGDKVETAIAIGHSTNLIGRQDNIIVIRGGVDGQSKSVHSQLVGAAKNFFPDSGILDGDIIMSPRSSMSRSRRSSLALQRVPTDASSLVGHDNGERSGGFVLVIDGSALSVALSDDRHKQLLLRLSMQCEGVICCRVSPIQKALIVKLVKEGLGSMTLAIGDGANDVSMIQAADVGVGISGQEGLQAANSSDYAIAQFRFLKRLLLVHGHWSYARNGNMIVNFFYKNIICIGVLWWFQIYCGWSSAYAFEYTYLLWWNSFFTIAPVIAIGLFDRHADDHILMALPELYSHSRRGEYFGTRLFLIYMFDGIVQSVLIFFLIFYGYKTTTSRTDGYAVYQYEFTTVMAISAVTTANLFNGLNTAAWTGWVFFAVALGIVLVWAYTAIYSAITPSWFVSPVYGNDAYLWPSAYFWFGIFLTVVLALLPRYVCKAYKFTFNPSDIDRVRWLHKLDPNRDFASERSQGIANLKETPSRRSTGSRRRPFGTHAVGSRTDMSTGVRSQSRGFDFSTEENGIALQRMQTNLSERHGFKSPFKRRKRSGSLLPHFSLSRSLRRKKPPALAEQVSPEPADRPPHDPPTHTSASSYSQL